jgi:hypothetical protein
MILLGRERTMQPFFNPFSWEDIILTAPITETYVSIPYSFVGREYDNQQGLFVGNSYLGCETGNQPIFVDGFAPPLPFSQNVVLTGKRENGYKANPHTYDAKEGLREGKMVIAPIEMVYTAYLNREIGEFAKLFKNIGLVVTSTTSLENPEKALAVDFRDGHIHCLSKSDYRARSLLVHAGLTP